MQFDEKQCLKESIVYIFLHLTQHRNVIYMGFDKIVCRSWCKRRKCFSDLFPNSQFGLVLRKKILSLSVLCSYLFPLAKLPSPVLDCLSLEFSLVSKAGHDWSVVNFDVIDPHIHLIFIFICVSCFY